MFHLSRANKIVVDKDLVILLMIAIIFVVVYFLSSQIQLFLTGIIKKFGKTVGVYSVGKDYQWQRYVYQNGDKLISKLYKWTNNQLIALGLKRQGVTVFGYLIFWAFVAVVFGTLIGVLFNLGVVFTVIFWFITFICLLILTRVQVSNRLEAREMDVMNAIDLIVPEAKNGIKNAIVTYLGNFAPSVREDFEAFVANIQDRGYSFPEAMYILADNLGTIFLDFAQKAVYYEAIGEKEMIDIFTDLTETNRLRRQLRDENSGIFANLKASFIVSTLLVVGYFCFLMLTDEASRVIFLQKTGGKICLICCILVVFLVMSYISTIKSRAI